MDYSNLTDDEVYELFKYQSATCAILAKLNVSSLESLAGREAEFAAEHYRRALNRQQGISVEAIEELMSYPAHSAARGIVGESAMRDLIPHWMLPTLIEQSLPAEWTHRQLVGRHLITAFCQEGSRNEPDGIIDQLLELKLAWALMELIPEMSDETIRHLSLQLSYGKVLSKFHRHQLRELIKRREE